MCMYKKKHSINRLWSYLQFQVSTRGLRLYPLWISGDYYTICEGRASKGRESKVMGGKWCWGGLFCGVSQGRLLWWNDREEPRPKGSEGLSGCRNRSGGVLSVF